MIEVGDFVYNEFTVTLPVNGHKSRGKLRILQTLTEVTKLLDGCYYRYELVFRARKTHIKFRVLSEVLT